MRIGIFNWNNILTDLALALKERGHTVSLWSGGTKGINMNDYDLFIFWNEIGSWGKFVKKAQKKGKKTILVQHGRRGTSRIYPPFNEPLNSDVVCVWGEADRERLKSVGIDGRRIRVVGTPIFRHLKARQKHKGINVVFSPEHWDGEVIENSIVAGQLRKIDGVKIITKILDGEHYASQYDNPVPSQRNHPDHFKKVAEVLSVADVVVGISESTFELLAESLDIPVVIADIWMPKACGNDERYKEYHREYSRACVRVKDPLKLGEAIKYAVKHPEHLRQERREVVVEDGGPADFIKNMLNLIEAN